MLKRIVSGIMLTLLFMSALMSTFNIQPAKATGTIYIRADGSIDPPTAQIHSVDNVIYTFTSNINDFLVIQRSNIVVDGAGYILQGTGSGTGLNLSERSNVTIKNMEIKTFRYGILLYSSSNNNSISGNNITANNWAGIWLNSSSNNNSISGNNITANNYEGIVLAGSSSNSISGNNITVDSGDGILLHSSSNNNSISGNNIANNGDGIWLWDSSNNNSISGNNITANKGNGISLHSSSNNNSISGNNITANNANGILLGYSSSNSISGNNIANNGEGIWSNTYSSNNSISGNNIANNGEGIWLWDSSNNKIYHNNFVNNTHQAYSNESINVWDDGYPSGGNYWSDFKNRYPTAVDIYSSPHQNETGSDAIWDNPYAINENNQDNYPLTTPIRNERVVGDLGGGLPPVFFRFDGKVDGMDLALFVQCYKGLAPQEAIYLADLGGGVPPKFFECDGKVDGKDLALFIQCYKGQGPDT